MLSRSGFEEVAAEAVDRFAMCLQDAYEKHALYSFLKRYGMDDLLPYECQGLGEPDGQIVIIGASAIKEKEIKGLFKSLGISSARLELHLEYTDLKRGILVSRLRNNFKYRLILMGPTPHSGTGKGDYESVLSMMQNEQDFFAKIIVLNDGHGLKMTKSNIREVLQRELDSGYIAAD